MGASSLTPGHYNSIRTFRPSPHHILSSRIHGTPWYKPALKATHRNTSSMIQSSLLLNPNKCWLVLIEYSILTSAKIQPQLQFLISEDIFIVPEIIHFWLHQKTLQ